ncbi:MAG: VOC family protein [Bacteroidetes bacterium]|nr:VOC family protein [Bacteroidota bacterium]
MANVLNWFEIPVTDMDRAVKFYSQVLGKEFTRMDMLGVNMAFFPMEGQGVGGSLCKGEWYKPTQDGAVVYLNGGEDLAVPLSKVETAGGKVIMPKKYIADDIGYMALFIDSEGNRVAFHSNK